MNSDRTASAMDDRPADSIEVTFAADGNCGSYLGQGWGIREAKWVWTTAPECELAIPVPAGGGGWACALHLFPFLHGLYLRNQRLGVLANGHRVFSQRIDQLTQIRFEISPEQAGTGGVVRLVLQCPDCVPPAVVGAGNDARYLGFACLHLALSPLVVPAAAEGPAPKIAYGGLAEPRYTETSDIGTFGRADHHERLRIFPSLVAPPQIRLHREESFEPEFIAEHYRYPQPPDICVYALKNCVLWGNGLLTDGGRFVLPDDCMPGYFRGYVQPGGHSFPDNFAGPIAQGAAQTIELDGLCGVAIHPNVVYGHVLLEILPRLFLLAALRDLGCPIRLAVITQLPKYMYDIIALYFSDREIVYYDMTTQNLRASSFILPSMMHTDHNFHPAFGLMVNDVLWRAGVAGSAAGVPAKRKIYLSRRQLRRGWHYLENEAEVEDVLTDLGFTVVHPQDLSLREQLAVYASADIIVGQYGSALHNAVFSRPGTKVIGLNCINWYQSAIGRVRRHRLAYVPPTDGMFRTWRERDTGNANFAIDPGQLRTTVREMLAEGS